MDKANTKENAMKASYISALLVTCFALSACGESNPFKFQSDPLSADYAGLKSYDTPVETAQIKPEIIFYL
jgi:hypothetical protein